MPPPADERLQPHHFGPPITGPSSVSDEDNTVVGDGSLNPSCYGGEGRRQRSNSRLTVATVEDHYPTGMDKTRSVQSPSQTRERARLEDDLAMLQVERQVSASHAPPKGGGELNFGKSMARERSRREEVVDEFDAATNPIHEKAAAYKPPDTPTTELARFFKKVHGSSFLVRYFVYIIPVVLVLLLPLLLGVFVFTEASVGGVQLMWFCIWLEIVWLTLWAGRIFAKAIPWPLGLISSLFTNNSKKWRDMGKQLELPATLFFWWLAIEISFLPTMKNHHIDGNDDTKSWEHTMNKLLLAVFIGMILNFVEKIVIQLIAISFHLRTYSDRIELNKFQIGSLMKLYEFSKKKIDAEDSDFEAPSGGVASRTPGTMLQGGQQTVVKGFRKFGDVAGKIAGDFTGHAVKGSTHPQQVVLTLLNSTSGSQILARRLYRTFYREEDELVHSKDLQNAFQNPDEADAAFTMFDKDMNGDISMEELESVCVEIGRERKSITASLKDLDSVISKLDDVFMFIVLAITILVFISLISTSAAGVLTSAGSTVLALSWLFSATAQEFLQSVVFVFVKHPFDVGDRVGIYGNTGSNLKGDDYFVKEIALLYTEFKKMEGHVVQAPNSYLNTLFILNQRRSGGLAEALPVTIKFGTTLEQIDSLRQRLLEFVTAEKREFQPNILTELRDVVEAHALTLNIVFFYKSNWQNELLRLQRRNKFICAMMISMQELDIEGPHMRFPGQKESFPVYLQNVPHVATPGMGHGGHPDNPQGHPHVSPTSAAPDDAAGAGAAHAPPRDASRHRAGSQTRARGETMAAMGRRLDFSLGMKDVVTSDFTGDVYEGRGGAGRARLPSLVALPGGAELVRSREKSSLEARARSSSVEVGETGEALQRVGTDSSSAARRASHRNRFFGRIKGALPNDEEQAIMAGIPEGERSRAGAGSPVRGGPGERKLDPRTGMVSAGVMRGEEEGEGLRIDTDMAALRGKGSRADGYEMMNI